MGIFREALKALKEQGSFDNSKPITLREAMGDALDSYRFFSSEKVQKAIQKQAKKSIKELKRSNQILRQGRGNEA
jgi:transcription initiation factor IIE alpha subunit